VRRVLTRGLAGDAAAPASSGASWDAVKVESLSETSRRELAGLQKAVADMRDAMARMAYKGPEPDFAAMKKQTKNPEFVEEFEKAYKSVTAPDMAMTQVDTLKKNFAELEAQAKKHATHATTRMAELEAELKSIEAQREKIGTMTMDEYFETNPELKKKIDEKIKNDQWFDV